MSAVIHPGDTVVDIGAIAECLPWWRPAWFQNADGSFVMTESRLRRDAAARGISK